MKEVIILITTFLLTFALLLASSRDWEVPELEIEEKMKEEE